MTAPQVIRTFKVTPLPRWFTRKYDSGPAARAVTTHVMDATSISMSLRRLDLENIAMLMFSLGCGSLFEYGFVYVVDGKILHNPRR
ncbi:hypothetical protein [Pseudomonas putida]|uniref:hypothetical protein n=1 Tax=Pseudomonas putida TaxID=303 RepID=UPI001F518874|nr:hypothetical protein [Pseudomonas putida]